MKTIITKLFSHRNSPDTKGLSKVVCSGSIKEQNQFIKKVIRESNKDQRKIVEKYKRQLLKV